MCSSLRLRSMLTLTFKGVEWSSFCWFQEGLATLVISFYLVIRLTLVLSKDPPQFDYFSQEFFCTCCENFSLMHFKNVCMLKKKWIKTITVLKIIFYENNLIFVKIYDVMTCKRINKGNKVEKRLVIVGIKYCLEQNYHSWNFAIVNTFQCNYRQV